MTVISMNETPAQRRAATLAESAPRLLAALVNIECGANTLDYCYFHRQENFAAALRDLREYAQVAREAIEQATGAHDPANYPEVP